jgi:hypothetical protein
LFRFLPVLLLLVPLLCVVLLYSGSVLNTRWPRPLWAYLVVEGVFALAGAGALLYAAPAKTRAKASRGWSLLALPGLEPNWLLALYRRALPAINLGFFNICQPNPGGECCAVEAKGKT